MFIFGHTLFENVPRELVSLLEWETILDLILFFVIWSRLILIYAIIVSSHSQDELLQSRDSSRQVTGARIRLQSFSTARTRHSMRERTVIWQQDQIIIEEVLQKNKRTITV